MKKLMTSLVLLLLIGILLFSVNEKYHLAEWVTKVAEALRHENPDDFIHEVREAMLEGKEHVELIYVGKCDNMDWFTEGAIDMAFEIDDASTSSDFDYLKYNVNSINAHIVRMGNIVTVSYDFIYNETSSETAMVDAKIDYLFDNWNIEELSDYEKIKTIHDYIVNNASYDTSLMYYSAYDNLINKSSTCQGYMCLAYKMLTEAGIPTRIIAGKSKKETHGWNIVQLGGKWYNLDCTWDDPITSNGKDVLLYDYFLKSDREFGYHIRDEYFMKKEFKTKYEIAEKSYEK